MKIRPLIYARLPSVLILLLSVGTVGSLGQTITSFEPEAGMPGTPVTINGPNFQAPITVRFNGVVDPTAQRVATTQIRAQVPAGATTGPISVTTPQGTVSSLKSFIVLGLDPFITDFSPVLGPAGTLVTITGFNFGNATSVLFNGLPAAFDRGVSDTQIMASAPPGVTTGPISVVNPFGTNTTSQSFFVPPVITRFFPTNGAPGTAVQIYGSNFTGVIAVRFGDLLAASNVESPTNIVAIVPPDALSGPISVAAPGGVAFSATNFLVAPRIHSFSPQIGGASTSVEILGVNFTGASAVTFNSAPAATFRVDSSIQITATAPNGVSSGPITVTAPGGTGLSVSNFYVAPRISGFSPSGGATGTVVTISGLNFLGATNVRFGSRAAPINSVNTNQIVAVVPTNATTGPLSVTAPAGTFTTSSNFVVFTTSNLGVMQSDSPDPVTAGDTLTYSIVVTNLGPKDATLVMLTNTLSPSVSFVSATLSQGTFAVNNRIVACSLGTLASGGGAAVTLRVAPTVAGTITNIASARSAELDPDASNNSSTVLTTVLAAEAPELAIRRSGLFVEVSWPAAATNFVLQSNISLSSTNWVTVEDPPIVVGGRNTYSFSTTGGTRRFFRLKSTP